MKDYYSLLGVRQFASAAEVKRAYRRLAFQYHPDKNPDPQAEIVIKQINEAYDLLGDPVKKALYDQMLTSPVIPRTAYQKERTERYAAHRDPAYRGSGRHAKPYVSNREKIYQIIAHYHPRMLWISRASIFFSLIFFLDFIIPYRTADEIILHSRMSGSHDQGADYLMELRSGENFKIYKTELRFKDDERISVTYTRVYGIPMALEKIATGEAIEMGYMYSTLLFLPLGMLFVSAMAVAFRQNVEFSFNLIVLNGMLLLINFTFL
jgi:hypothetical protein